MGKKPDYDPGKYRIEFKSAEITESKKNTPMILLVVQVQDKILEDGSLEALIYTLERKIYVTITEEYRGLSLAKLRYAGWTGNSFGTIGTDLPGLFAVAECKHETQTEGRYAGSINERWDLELPPKDKKPVDVPKVVADLDSLFGKELLQPVEVPVRSWERKSAEDTPF